MPTEAMKAMTEKPLGRAPGPGDQLFLVDGSSFVFRAYFQSMNQDAKYNYRSDGLPTGALRLFSTKLYQFLLEGAVGLRPTHMAIVFDKAEQTFRKEIYADYKATRKDPPDDLVPQFPLMREAVQAFGLLPVEQAGYEADDVIATYATQAERDGADTLIISADKDLMQLVSEHVLFYDFESGARGRPGYRPERKIDREGVIEYFGLPPDKVVDIQALVGDPSDNVPGVPGIGVKTAAQLIGEFGSLEALLDRLNEIKQPKRRETLIANAENARLSKRLVSLDRTVAVDTPLAASALPPFDARRLLSFLKAMELNTLVKRVSEAANIDPETVESDPKLRAKGRGTAAHPGQVGTLVAGYTKGSAATPPTGDAASPPDEVPAPRPVPAPWSGGDLFGRPEPPAPPTDIPLTVFEAASGSEAIAATVAALPFDPAGYRTITGVAGLEALVEMAARTGTIGLVLTTAVADPMRADLVGIGLATAAGQASYLPLGHRGGGTDDLLASDLAAGQVDARGALELLRPVLEDPAIIKIGHDLKAATLLLSRYGIALDPIDDVMLMAYALEAGRRDVSLLGLSERWLDHHPADAKSILGTGRNAITFDRAALGAATAYAAEAADIVLRLASVLKPRLVTSRVATVYQTLERPMVRVLADMERHGVAVDRQILSRLSGEFAQAMGGLEDEIAQLAGEPFNIASPKQLGDILFGKMKLPGGRKTKTGAWSTDADILEELAAEHALPAKVLEWRQVSKLKSTYTDALPGFIHPETGRVHTSYALAATPTARLSSSEPNLQNIPVRTEMGRKIRTAFVAEDGNKLISADYSQIELRVLAHIAEIPQLRAAFADGLDIHAITASEMFGVPVAGMPADVRRRAKAINFGIIYGISAFGLANQLSIARAEAKDYIDRYFQKFPGIRDYMETTKAFCRENGYVVTIFGRKCHYPLILSRNPAERAFNERAAVNATIQGSAADIIRRAMIRMPKAFFHAGLKVRMLLQVHDELVFEAPDAQVEDALPLIRRVMEASPEPVVKLRVPIKVDARAGSNWEAAH